MDIDISIPQETLEDEIQKSGMQYALIISWIAICIFPFWCLLDYFFQPENWLFFLKIRFAVSAIILVAVLAVQGLKLPIAVIGYANFIGLSAALLFFCVSAEKSAITLYMSELSIVVLVCSSIVFWKIKHFDYSLIFIFVAFFILFWLFKKYKIEEYFINGGFLLVCVVIVARYISSIRYQTELNRIKEELAATKSKKYLYTENYDIKAQNEKIRLQNEKIEEQSRILQDQNIEIATQKHRLEEVYHKVTDSINYAKHIQTAVLPQESVISSILKDYFVYYLPKDIVSGDFYWVSEHEDKLLIAVADCTGHGVPGAFMSILGISLLNEVVNKLIDSEDDNLQANTILNYLRGHMKSALGQTQKNSKSRDGMDMALCIIDRKTLKMQYAGANNPVWIYRSSEIKTRTTSIPDPKAEISNEKLEEILSQHLIELKADRMPIGIHLLEGATFTNREIQLQQFDMIYLFTDGYEDQFGGREGRKFLSKNLKKLLLSLYDKSLPLQKSQLQQIMETWKSHKYEQVDDILVFGVRI